MGHKTSRSIPGSIFIALGGKRMRGLQKNLNGRKNPQRSVKNAKRRSKAEVRDERITRKQLVSS